VFVTAEGSSRRRRKPALAELRCHHLQGFHFGSAMAEDELLALAREQRQKLRAA
jgi:EAL domain-containing protein (putative c-di-GMP-specific phosphodiesterase class I)